MPRKRLLVKETSKVVKDSMPNGYHKDGKNRIDLYMTLGCGGGIAVGAGVGAALGDIGIGAGLGVAVGTATGLVVGAVQAGQRRK